MCQPDERSLGDGVQLPFVGDAFEGVAAAVGELDTRPDDEIPDCPRDQYFPLAGESSDPRADVDGDLPDVVAPQLHFAGVEAGADGDGQAVAQSGRTTNGARRAVERRQQTVARRLDQLSL